MYKEPIQRREQSFSSHREALQVVTMWINAGWHGCVTQDGDKYKAVIWLY